LSFAYLFGVYIVSLAGPSLSFVQVGRSFLCRSALIASLAIIFHRCSAIAVDSVCVS
jgi:hypothetical protein